MVAPTAMLILVLALAVEGLVLWVDQLHRTRREAAYWHQVEHRPALYDWAEDGDQ
jgi:hypothetical protein